MFCEGSCPKPLAAGSPPSYPWPMASNLTAMASDLRATASNLKSNGLQPKSNGLHPVCSWAPCCPKWPSLISMDHSHELVGARLRADVEEGAVDSGDPFDQRGLARTVPWVTRQAFLFVWQVLPCKLPAKQSVAITIHSQNSEICCSYHLRSPFCLHMIPSQANPENGWNIGVEVP